MKLVNVENLRLHIALTTILNRPKGLLNLLDALPDRLGQKNDLILQLESACDIGAISLGRRSQLITKAINDLKDMDIR